VSATWKAVERKVAARLGGQRVGCTGEATPDVETDWADIEIKHRAALPKWLTGAMEQAVRNCADGKLPLLVLHEKGRHDMLVVMRLSDFDDWHGGLEEIGR